ncbi:MAG: radical SAM family heme chaperone HemW [Phycisphaerales bacterium]|nr:radical SAM family heme chaperone HemW [Phycisphaerales bacterium]
MPARIDPGPVYAMVRKAMGLDGAVSGPSGGDGPARSLYIHIPFCFHKCHYCDFYSIVDSRDRQKAFTARLVRELRALAPFSGGLPLETIFVGGGTPTLLAPGLWVELLAALDDAFDLSVIRSGIRAGRGEFTVECNPETATPELMGVLAGGGVNRVSIGAQSFDPAMLKVLERWHDPENVGRAVELAAAAGIDRRSVDLIYAIPGQTLQGWGRDLERAISLGVTHLSAYNLTYEPNTAMTMRLKQGEFAPTPEELEVEMFGLTRETLTSAGLDRYEVSNYAVPGHECAHNLAYWRQKQWIAAGPSASGHLAGHRYKIVARLGDYLQERDDGFAPLIEHEARDARRALAEIVMTGLRLREGLDAQAVLARADAIELGLGERGLGERIEREVQRWERVGYLLDDGGAGGGRRWSLTEAGVLFADGIASEFIARIG